MSKSLKQFGFTLIEVMVALAVVAIALAALSRSMGVTIANQSQLETRIVANWVAQNELLKMHVIAASGSQIEQKQKITMLNREWTAEIKTEPTPIPGIHKAVVEVSDLNSPSNSVRLVTVVGE